MTDRYSHYKALKFASPRPRVLEIILSKPGRLNALDGDGHAELAQVWRDVDRDPATSVAVLRGEGGVFSAGGDLGMVEVMARDWATRTRVWKEASDLVYNIINCHRRRHRGPLRRRRSSGRIAVRHLGCRPQRSHHRWSHPAWGGCRGPLGDHMAAAVRHGQGQILPAVV